MSSKSRSKIQAQRGRLITQVLDAPVEGLWRAWADHKHVIRCLGSIDFTSLSCRIDFREGGR